MAKEKSIHHPGDSNGTRNCLFYVCDTKMYDLISNGLRRCFSKFCYVLSGGIMAVDN